LLENLVRDLRQDHDVLEHRRKAGLGAEDADGRLKKVALVVGDARAGGGRAGEETEDLVPERQGV
jgi:hypothetical protein